MQTGIEAILRMFLFSEHLLTIALVCLVVFLGNFFGGLLNSILVAYSGPQRERPLKERMSIRLMLMSDLFLVIYAVYYHAILVRDIELAQVFYWLFALVTSPLLALLGSQITYVLYAKQIEGNKEKWRKHEVQQRAAALSAAERAANAVLKARRTSGRHRN